MCWILILSVSVYLKMSLLTFISEGYLNSSWCHFLFYTYCSIFFYLSVFLMRYQLYSYYFQVCDIFFSYEYLQDFMSFNFSSLPRTWLNMGLILFTLMGFVWVSWMCYFFMKARKKISHNYFNHLSMSCSLKFHADTSFLETAPWSMNSLCLILNFGQPLYHGYFLWNGFSNLFSLNQIVNIYRVHTPAGSLH